MYSKIKQRNARRTRRKMSVRKKVRGTAERPRLSVFKSNKHLFAQLIDDESRCTLLSVSTIMKEIEKPEFKRKSKVAARYVGELLAGKAKTKMIQTVVFDRGHNKYHGLIAELADAAREGGLKF